MEVLIMIGQVVLALGILVTLHELGHMMPARWFGMRVEKFYLFFDAWGKKLFSKKSGDTEYGIGWLPLGGYVKIAGMVDESMDTKGLKEEPEEWEFRAKPAWQRLIVMLGGVTVNLILGILIFAGLTFFLGEGYIANKDVSAGIYAGKIAREIGFQHGDKIISVNGKEIIRFADALDPSYLLEGGAVYKVDRQGNQVEIRIPDDMLKRISETEGKEGFFGPAQPFSVDRVAKGSPAALGGLLPGDRIVSIAGQPIQFFQEVKPILMENKCCKVDVGIKRGAADSLVKLKLVVSENATLGFFPKTELKESFEEKGLFESLSIGYSDAFDILKFNILGFSKLFSGEVKASQAVSGPVGIASEFFGGHFSWPKFWRNTGILSLILAFMNLLPIPALDGGHSVFLLYEMITRRPPSLKFMEWAQTIGMILILGLMVFAFGNDFYKIMKKEPDACKCELVEPKA
jgi:regulator of sigma E protease